MRRTELDATALGVLRRADRRAASRGRWRRGSTTSTCPRARPLPPARDRRRRRRGGLRRQGGPAAPRGRAAAMSTWRGCARGGWRTLPTPCSSPPTRPPWDGCSTPARRTASPWCRSAAAPAWSAGSSRCAAPHAALISLDLTALREVAVDDTSLTARLGAGPARARGGGGARRRRASPSATSRSPSSTRRSAASPPPARPARPRAATGASTRWSARCDCSPRPGT